MTQRPWFTISEGEGISVPDDAEPFVTCQREVQEDWRDFRGYLTYSLPAYCGEPTVSRSMPLCTEHLEELPIVMREALEIAASMIEAQLAAQDVLRAQECWCSDSAQEYGLKDVGCPRHATEADRG